MIPEQSQQIIEYSRAIVKILYKNTDSEQLISLAKIEEKVRYQMQEYVMPEVVFFFIKNVTGESRGYKRQIKSIMGELQITSSQAQKLEIRPHNQLSPYKDSLLLKN